MRVVGVGDTAGRGVEGKGRLASRCFRNEGGVTPLEVYRSAEPTEGLRAFWAQRDGEITLVGLGVVWGVSVSGKERFRQARDWYREIVDCVEVEGPGVAGTGPLAMGGFRFDIDAETSPEWQRFGDGMMFLPRVCYSWTPEGNWITKNEILPANGESDHSDIGSDPRHCGGVEMKLGERVGWADSVTGALGAVRRGEVEKVVMARR